MPGETLGRIAVVTVHGTGDTAPKLDGEKWFQRGAAFTEKLKGLLSAKGFEADIHPVLWSGANSARAREDGADEVADAIKRLSRQYDGQVHLIGHSHGGNVVNEAVDLLRWGRTKRKSKIASVTTVGTPFFRSQLGWFGSFGGLAFLVLTSLLALLMLGFAGLSVAMWNSPDFAEDRVFLFSIWIGLGISAIVLAYMMYLGVQWTRRVLRPRNLATSKSEIHAIAHPHDEAITFLKRVEEFPVEAFTRGALLRNSRAVAISWGSWSMIFASILIIVAAAVPDIRMSLATVFNLEEIEADPVDILATFLLLPVVWGGMYLFARGLFGLFPELALRGWFNSTVGAIIKGMAFGRDGDDRLSTVSSTSHTHPTREAALDGAIAERMQAGASTAADKLISKYRWALFSTSADSTDSIAKLSTDAMTWDSLIHTTYFDQPEVAEMIAAYIAEKAANRA